jgi:hypothetical protein
MVYGIYRRANRRRFLDIDRKFLFAFTPNTKFAVLSVNFAVEPFVFEYIDSEVIKSFHALFLLKEGTSKNDVANSS